MADTGELIEPDAIDFDELPLPVLDERGDVIGIASNVWPEGNGWAAGGLVAGLEPGDYRVGVYLDQRRVIEDGDITRLTRGVLRSITVLAGPDGQPSFSQASIRVGETPGQMNLTKVRPPAHEVLTYPE